MGVASSNSMTSWLNAKRSEHGRFFFPVVLTEPRLWENRAPKSLKTKRKLVGAPRFELGTSWSRTKRATRLRYAPNLQR